jgi:hypothetical protein
MGIYRSSTNNRKSSNTACDTKASDLLKEQLAWLEDYGKTNPKKIK